MSYQFVPIPMGSVPPEGWKPPAWWGGPPLWGGGWPALPALPPGVWPQPPGGGKPPSWGGPVDPGWGVTPPVDPGWGVGGVPGGPAIGGGPAEPPAHPWLPGHGNPLPGWGGGWGSGPHPWWPIHLPIYPSGPGGKPVPMPPIYTPVPPSVQYVVCFTIAVPPEALIPPPAPPTPEPK